MREFAEKVRHRIGGKIETRTILIVLAATAGFFLIYQVAAALLIVFAGMLVGAILDAAVVGLGRFFPVRRIWRLLIVAALSLALILAGIAWGGYSLVSQGQNMVSAINEQLETLAALLSETGLDMTMSDEDGTWRDMLPSSEALFGHAQTAFGSTIGFVGNAVIVVFLGIFFAANPAGYRDGFVKLVPPARRARTSGVLTEAGLSLRWWLVGQLAMMIVVGVSVAVMLLLVGIPNAIMLGVLAGLLNFIPYLGPIMAAIPVFLAAIPEGWTTFLLVATLFVVIESIEGYLFAPLIQERAVHLPPAWSLASLLVAGALFGGIGIALATPLLAVLRILVLRFYVEDWLEADGRHNARLAPASRK